MTLRLAVLAFGGLLLLLAALLASHPAVWGAALYCLIYGVLLVGAILLERGRYQAKSGSSGRWERTDERFTDPTTGEPMEVQYNPQTGQRRYVSRKSGRVG